MYNSSEGVNTSYNDAKYTVADILSSMANGNPGITPTTESYPQVSMTGRLAMTPILTPTTLANIEQTFMELSSSSGANSLSQQHMQPTMTQSGFVPPLVEPVQSLVGAAQNVYTGSYLIDESTESDSDADWIPPSVKKARIGGQGDGMSMYSNKNPNVSSTNIRGAGRKPTGPRRQRYEKLTPEEEGKRSVRRERNKLAAAKCRQRRVDQTNTLQEETDCLEQEKGKLEHEIQTLQQQKEQLEFLLEAHKPMCSKAKVTQDSNNSIPTSSNAGESFANLVRVEAVQEATIKSEPNGAPPRARPNTLAIAKRTTNIATISESAMTAATGVPVNTPSSGVFATLTLDTMVDHTGLTPLTGNPSCSAVANRSSSESSTDALASPTTLMAL